MNSLTYLMVNLGCLIIPLIFSFHPKIPFHREWKFFLPANIVVSLFFLVWDYFFTYYGVWGFNSFYLLGIDLFNLPIEEVLFFICIPYACVFTFFCLQNIIKKLPVHFIQKVVSITLIVLLIMVSLIYLKRIYTSFTFLTTASFLIYLIYKKIDLSLQYLTYIVIYPFFLISNGILTGIATESPVVWYNDNYNLGFRLWTIPIEDSIYGFLLIFLNIHLYLFFKEKFKLTGKPI